MLKSSEVDDSLSKLANKAKRKLSKQGELETLNKTRSERYVFLNLNNNDEIKRLQKKIVQIKMNNPDCIDPIGKLIDHKIYDKLSESQKQNYILKLADNYRKICEGLK